MLLVRIFLDSSLFFFMVVFFVVVVVVGAFLCFTFCGSFSLMLITERELGIN